MAGASILAWQNAVKTAVLTASSAEPLLPATNLTNDLGAPSVAWQTLAGALSGVLLTVTPAVRTTFRAFGIFQTNMTNVGTVTARAYTNPGAVLVGTWAMTMVGGQCVAVAAADTPADYVTFTFTDAANPDNHLNIPLVYAGPAWQPLTAMSWTSALGRDDITDAVVSRGGQQYFDMRATSRRWEIAMDGVRASEVFTQLDVVDAFSRTGGNVLVIPDTTSGNQQYEAVFGVLKATADIAWPFGSADRRSWRARLTERL
jgi:hypothetical protein